MFELVVINKTCPATMSMECNKHKLLISMLHYTYSVSMLLNWTLGLRMLCLCS